MKKDRKNKSKKEGQSHLTRKIARIITMPLEVERSPHHNVGIYRVVVEMKKIEKTRLQIIDLKGELNKSIKQLQALLREHAWFAEVYDLGLPPARAERNKKGGLLSERVLPNEQKVELVSGDNALTLAIDAMGLWEKDPEQEGVVTRKYPGVINVRWGSGGEHFKQVTDAVEDVNQRKERLSQAFLEIKSPTAKQNLRKEIFEGENYLQATRKIPIIAESPQRIKFSWAGRTARPEIIETKVVLNFLHAAFQADDDQAEDISTYQKLYARVMSLVQLDPEGHFIHHVPQAYRPRIALYYDQTRKPDQQTNASMPYIVPAEETVENANYQRHPGYLLEALPSFESEVEGDHQEWKENLKQGAGSRRSMIPLYDGSPIFFRKKP